MRVIFFDDNVRMDVNFGDEVFIIGVVRGIMRKKNGKFVFGWVFEVKFFMKLMKDIEDFEIIFEDV